MCGACLCVCVLVVSYALILGKPKNKVSNVSSVSECHARVLLVLWWVSRVGLPGLFSSVSGRGSFSARGLARACTVPGSVRAEKWVLRALIPRAGVEA